MASAAAPERSSGATVALPGGMVLDKNSNLVVCDQDAEAVDIIKPPYSRISGTLGSGYSDPTTVTINKTNTQAYVANYGGNDVLVLSYPDGLRTARRRENGPAVREAVKRRTMFFLATIARK